jgi:hypothetical protein
MFPDLVNKMRVHPDPRINLQIVKLYKKQLKQVPGSKLHRETSAEIQKLLKMPAPKTEKEKLQAKTVDQLKRQAKKVGANVIDPKTGKAKTKEQLVNSIVMKLRLSGQSDRQTGKSNSAKDATRQAKAPGKRTSAKGKTYYERRANRSDRGFMLGAGMVSPAKAKALEKKRDLIRKYIDEIIEVGPNYAVWQNAQGAYKNAKAIEKLLRNW